MQSNNTLLTGDTNYICNSPNGIVIRLPNNCTEGQIIRINAGYLNQNKKITIRTENGTNIDDYHLINSNEIINLIYISEYYHNNVHTRSVGKNALEKNVRTIRINIRYNINER